MYYVVLLSVLVAVGRFFVPGHEISLAGSYEAMAHIWVGVLLTLAFTGERKSLAWAAIVVLTVLETVMFLGRGA